MVIIMKFTTLCYIEKNDKYLMLYRNKKERDFLKEFNRKQTEPKKI